MIEEVLSPPPPFTQPARDAEHRLRRMFPRLNPGVTRIDTSGHTLLRWWQPGPTDHGPARQRLHSTLVNGYPDSAALARIVLELAYPTPRLPA